MTISDLTLTSKLASISSVLTVDVCKCSKLSVLTTAGTVQRRASVRTVVVSPLLQGNVPTRESIHMYYQNHMMKLSRESGLDTIDEHSGAGSRAQAAHRMDSLDSHDSISRYFTF